MTTTHEALLAAVADARSYLEAANYLWRSADQAARAARRHADVVGDVSRAAERALEEAVDALEANVVAEAEPTHTRYLAEIARAAHTV